MASGLVMLGLGTFRFSVNSAAYDQLVRKSGYTWAAQNKIGDMPALQFTGTESETINLKGVIYPEYLVQWRGLTGAQAFGQIEAMRQVAAQGQPQLLCSGLGDSLGKWVIESIEETQSNFFSNGVGRKQEFNISLKKYANAASPVLLVAPDNASSTISNTA